MIAALTPLIVFIFKIIIYYTALRIRKLDAKWMTASMCAGSSILAGYVPLPGILHFAVSIALAAFFISKNTDAELYPDAVGIPLAVEIISAFLLLYAVDPLIGLFV